MPKLRRPSHLLAILSLLWCVAGFISPSHSALWAKAPPGSVYVPLDNWVYDALDRLAGLGALSHQFSGLRPWTRIQCAQLAIEAHETLKQDGTPTWEAVKLDVALVEEFRDEIDIIRKGGAGREFGVGSTYTRSLGISGTPLRDGFHFGQTLADDYGRPFNTGFNNVSGLSTQAEWGRFFAYARGEYQYSPAYAGLTPAQQAYLELSDGTPTAPYSQAAGRVSKFNLLDTYVGVRISVFDVTFGKQSVWWGPSTMGGTLYSNNIDPVLMLKVNQVQPIVLPSILGILGPIRIEGFFGRLAGYPYPHAPYVHGEKIMFKPSPNLEVGLSRTTIAFGQGIPFSFGNLISTYFSTTDIGSNPNPRSYPGKRFGGLDFSYRLPYLRNWLTLYTDNMSSDDVNPLVNPSRAMYNPGLYLSRVPHIPQLDLRFEIANSRTHDVPYTSFFYHDGYTNKGFLIGNTVGRHGSAFDLSGTYWISPQKRIQVGWRKETVSKLIVPSGGAQDSIRIKADWFVQKQIELSALYQHEQWNFPFLAAGPQNNNVFSLQLTAYPKRLLSRTALRSGQ